MTRYERCDCDRNYERQRHDHEFTDSVKLAELRDNPHSHRVAGISGPAIVAGDSHYHEIETRTDFYEGHYHEIRGKSGPAIRVSEDRHVHYVYGKTTFDDGHKHEFAFASLIEDPTGK